MEIVALYKVWRGHEFFKASLLSIYNHVSKIVIVSSNRSWTGVSGNTALSVVEGFDDKLKKIEVVNTDKLSQEEQYEVGQKYINTNHSKADWILLIDTDEVWTETAWCHAMNALFANTKDVNAWNCKLHTYIKSTRYRIIETEAAATPIVFIRASIMIAGVRANEVMPRQWLDNVVIHHFSLVRDSYEEVLQKILTSCAGDKYDTLSDMEQWKAEVWDKIPNGECRHYYNNQDKLWVRFVEVPENYIPKSCVETGL